MGIQIVQYDADQLRMVTSSSCGAASVVSSMTKGVSSDDKPPLLYRSLQNCESEL